MLHWPRWAKQSLIILIDFALLLQAAWISYSLRMEEFTYWNESIAKIVLATVPSGLIIFGLSGAYSTVFRFADLGMMRVLVRSFLIYGVLTTTMITIGGISGVPRTVGIIQPILLFIMMIGSRIAIRFLLVDLLGRHQFKGKVSKVLLYGAGSAGQQIAGAFRSEPGMEVVGFVDSNPKSAGRKLEGKTIYGPDEIGFAIANSGATDVLLATPSATRRQRQKIVDSLKEYKVVVQTLPQLSDLAQGRVSISDIRPLQIEDLLGREPVAPDVQLFAKTIAELNVMVTGAGGSIGSELCRQIATNGANKLVLFELNEFALYEIETELRRSLTDSRAKDIEIIPVIGSVCDRERVDEVLQAHAIDTVYHAAAYKHVPLVEANPIEAITNNIIGTYTLASAARDNNVANCILISTDKAVRPTNVMGATKRVAEQVLQSFAAANTETLFSMVRFGNVLGSSGSVVPLFQEQIKKGGPITLTHKDINRYFMTIPEAAGLVIQAGGMAKGGEVFVLDMGQPVAIGDLAKTMIQLSGLSLRDEHNPDGDIAIVEVGLRPGEKLYEELLIGESPKETRHPRIMMAREGFLEWQKMKASLNELQSSRDPARSIEILHSIVPEFNHQPLGDVRSKAAEPTEGETRH